jgi:hypothetical protein
MKQNTVFVTYNPGNEFEQTLAVRLHTIGAVHGYNMLLPDRFNNSKKISPETAFRIQSSGYFIFFSTSALTTVVKEEINAAFRHLQDKSRIIIIYNRVKNLRHDLNCTEVFIDSKKENPQQILNKVIEAIKGKHQKPAQTQRKKDDTVSVLGGILLVGLGLLALDSMLDSSKK